MKFLSLSTFLLATAAFAGETEGPEFFAFGYEAKNSEDRHGLVFTRLIISEHF